MSCPGAYAFLPLENTRSDLGHHSLSRSPQGYSESPDLEFEYADTDKWAAELSGKAQTFMLFGGVFFSLLIFNKMKSECVLVMLVVGFKPCVSHVWLLLYS